MTEPARDTIEQRLAAWLAEAGHEAAAIEPLAGDVSARRYFRVRPRQGGSWVAAHYPIALADAQRRFARAAGLLDAAGVRVPALLADDPERGFALIEDLGPRTLYECEQLDADQRTGYLVAALDAASRIARLPASAVVALGSPPLDRALLARELEAPLRLGFAPRGWASAALEAGLEELCARLAADAPVPCHRDLMVRNLVPVGAGVGVLDFQDLRLGPPAYDLASLLNDSWFAPPAVEMRLVAGHLPAGLPAEQYRRAVVQRSLKAVGTYLSFAARGQVRHLPLVEPTLARALRFFPDLPELAPAWRQLAPRRPGAAPAIC